MSFIPPKCDRCGDAVTRKSNVNARLVCVNGDCALEFAMVRVTSVTRLKKEVII